MLFLYNKLLRQRKNFLFLQRGRVARQARQPPGLVSGDRDTGSWVGWPLSLDPEAFLAAGDIAAAALSPALALAAPLLAPEMHLVRVTRDSPAPALPQPRLHCLLLRVVLEGDGVHVPRLQPPGPRPRPGQQRGGGAGICGLKVLGNE